jgi:hypothetical protein
MSRVRIALASGLALMTVAIVLTLLHTPASIAGTDEAGGEGEAIATTEHGTTVCQGHQYLPAGTSEVQPKLGANSGPSVHVEVSAAGHVITSGQRGSGWSGRVVTIPVKPLAHAVSNATVCVSFSMHDEVLSIYGAPTIPGDRALEGGRTLGEKMWINYLKPARQTWAADLGAISRHLELGRTTTGGWIVVLTLALAAGVIALAVTGVLKELE